MPNIQIKEKVEQEFFDKLAEVLEEQFPKGEKCKCGKRLPCRSKALALNAYANIYLRDALKAEKQEISLRIWQRADVWAKKAYKYKWVNKKHWYDEQELASSIATHITIVQLKDENNKR